MVAGTSAPYSAKPAGSVTSTSAITYAAIGHLLLVVGHASPGRRSAPESHISDSTRLATAVLRVGRPCYPDRAPSRGGARYAVSPVPAGEPARVELLPRVRHPTRATMHRVRRRPSGGLPIL